ncbi:MAG TPA: hypothetical protein VME46_16915 [Acidimicrobiales bacterium]|nr:hypothetical protein [Acidimicrobiales bacterium]
MAAICTGACTGLRSGGRALARSIATRTSAREDLPVSYRVEVRPGRFGDKERDPSRTPQLDALYAQAQRVHGALGVAAVHRHELGPVGVAAGFAGHGRTLRAGVPEVALGR